MPPSLEMRCASRSSKHRRHDDATTTDNHAGRRVIHQMTSL
jgi:hypothetical protein